MKIIQLVARVSVPCGFPWRRAPSPGCPVTPGTGACALCSWSGWKVMSMWRYTLFLLLPPWGWGSLCIQEPEELFLFWAHSWVVAAHSSSRKPCSKFLGESIPCLYVKNSDSCSIFWPTVIDLQTELPTPEMTKGSLFWCRDSCRTPSVSLLRPANPRGTPIPLSVGSDYSKVRYAEPDSSSRRWLPD